MAAPAEHVLARELGEDLRPERVYRLTATLECMERESSGIAAAFYKHISRS